MIQRIHDERGTHAFTLGRPTPTLPLSKEEMFLYNFNENACTTLTIAHSGRLRAHVFWVCLLVWGISITHRYTASQCHAVKSTHLLTVADVFLRELI